MLDAFYDEVMTRFEFYLGAKKEEVQSFTSDGKLVNFSSTTRRMDIAWLQHGN